MAVTIGRPPGHPPHHLDLVNVDGEGRNGCRVQSEDGLLQTTPAIPKELGGTGSATDPEQLFAAGWAITG